MKLWQVVDTDSYTYVSGQSYIPSVMQIFAPIDQSKISSVVLDAKFNHALMKLIIYFDQKYLNELNNKEFFDKIKNFFKNEIEISYKNNSLTVVFNRTHDCLGDAIKMLNSIQLIDPESQNDFFEFLHLRAKKDSSSEQNDKENNNNEITIKLWNKLQKVVLNNNSMQQQIIQPFKPINQGNIDNIAFRYPSSNNGIDLFVTLQENLIPEFFTDILLSASAQYNLQNQIDISFNNEAAKVMFKDPEIFNSVICDAINCLEVIDDASKQEMLIEINNLLTTDFQNTTTLQSLAGVLKPKDPISSQGTLIEMQEFINKVHKGKGKEKIEVEFIDDEGYDEELELAIAASLEPQTKSAQLDGTSNSSHSSSSSSSSTTTTTYTTEKLWKRLEKNTYEDPEGIDIVSIRYAPIAKQRKIQDITLAHSRLDEEFTIEIQLSDLSSKSTQKLSLFVDELKICVSKAKAVFHSAPEEQTLIIKFSIIQEEFLQAIFSQINTFEPLDNRSTNEMTAEFQHLKPKVCQVKGKGKEKSTHNVDSNNNSVRNVSIFPPANTTSTASEKEPNMRNVLRGSK